MGLAPVSARSSRELLFDLRLPPIDRGQQAFRHAPGIRDAAPECVQFREAVDGGDVILAGDGLARAYLRHDPGFGGGGGGHGGTSATTVFGGSGGSVNTSNASSGESVRGGGSGGAAATSGTPSTGHGGAAVCIVSVYAEAA